MAEDTSLTLALCFRVFLCFFLAPLCAASCEKDAVGLADGYILDSQLTASSELNANSPAKNGRLNYTAGSSWCASTGDSNPYLQIDLQTLYIICAVSTQGNSQGDHWVDTYTLQSSTDGTTWTDYKEHGQSNKRSFNGNYDKDSTVKHVLYSGIVGRYLRFVPRVHGEVCLRVEIFGVPRSKGNIALFKPTSQSGTLATYESSYAVDGSKDTHYTKCSHTDHNTNKNPWWRVDLGRVEPVAEVFILNNGDLNGAEIRVGNSSAIGVADSYLCATAVAVPAGTSKTFFCKPIAYGRYVSISFKLGVSKYLKLCEVEVHSSYISNLALNQRASQVNTDHGGVASRAVDGNSNNKWSGGSCTHTDWATDPWWRVDLGSSFPVAKVVIVNRQCTGPCADVLKAFEIRIGNSNLTGGQSNPSCGGTHSMVTGETKSFYCTPRLLGRFVYVLVRAPPNNEKVLTICELEVYSTKQSMNDVKGCASDPVGVSNSVNFRNQRFSASSSLGGSSPSNGRLKRTTSAWIARTNNDNNDYLQIDLGSVYFVCGVAVQGNPAANEWTKTYKLEMSLDNVNWKFYSENGAVKNFIGNNDRNSIIRSVLNVPLAAKFIRFYPVSFNTSKALRVEVYGSLQGCLSTVGNERNVPRDLGIRASSQLDGTHTPSYSRLYGIGSWCSKLSGPLPHYLEFDFRRVITVTGLATQGDAVNHKWVTSYNISYGYDRQRWIRYMGQQLTGNSDRNTVVVNWLSKPFAAQYVKIFPSSYNSGICMRMDLFICKDFQVPYIFVNKLKDVQLNASEGATVTLKCTARFSPQRPPAYVWKKGATVLPGSNSSLTITSNGATDTHKNYNCGRKDPSTREVNCSSTYQCTASLPGMEDTSGTKVNVIVSLKVPGPPTVNSGNIKARSASVTWSYSPRSDELSIDEYTLQYQNRSFKGDITLSGSSTSEDLINLKPYTSYSVRMMAKSVLGEGLWSGLVNFTTKTAVPEVTVQLVSVTGLTSQSISLKWQKPDLSKLNGPHKGYIISYKKARETAVRVNASNSSLSMTLNNLKKWTEYFIKIAVNNGDYLSPWSNEKNAWTKQDAPSEPQNLQLHVQDPNGNVRPRMTVSWGKPANENGIITKYTLDYTYTFEGKLTTRRHTINSGNIFSYSFDVLGGINYTVILWAKTIKPGTKATNAKQVPVYAPSIAPPNITSEKIDETTYRISWDPLPREMSNGKVIAYEVNQTMVYSSHTARAISTATTELINTTDTFTVLSGLKECSGYSVQVRAYTTAGPGVFGSLPRSIETTAPGPPSDFKTAEAKERSITLSWSKPTPHGDAVKKYTVIYVGTKDYDSRFKHAGTREATSVTLTVDNLYPGTMYSFVVIAKSDCGEGENSTEASSPTKRGAPVAPVPHDLQEIETTETSVNVTVWPALQTNGPISHYQLLVHHVKQWTDDVSDWEVYGKDFYICAQIPAASVKPSMVFVIGDEKTYDGHVNRKLLGGQKYKIYSRGLTSKTKKKRSTDQQFLFGEARLIAQVDVDEVVIASESPTSAKNQGSPTAAIAASVVVVLVVVLVVLVAGVIFWRRRRQLGDRDSKSESHAMTAVNGAFDTAVNEAEIVQENPPAEEAAAAAAAVARVPDTGDPIYGNTEPAETDDKPKPVPVNRFSEYVTRLKREKNAGFGKQYKMLVPGQQFSWDVAKKPENKNKNRYGNIIAYDHSRVPLPFIDGVEHSDYMNASYLHGYDGTPKTYIASQGPVPGTYQDFWRMIWQENATTIVMLTRLVEHGRTKCHQYWPEKSETYHEITVTNHKTEKFADYAVRTFVLCENESGERRQVQQFHFLVWPDKGVPRHATAVLGLRRKVRAKHRDSAGPLVVHCSAGVGRTGAFVVIDAMLESARNKKVVDVFNYVQMIRANRISMVQTEEQYGFIYMALLEAVTCGNTEIPAHDIRIAVKKLATVNPKTKLSGLALEYQRLELITADDVADREDDVGLKPKNASKNRFPDIVPLNGSRVVLKGDENNDYINASFVDTYRERNSFILTQAPLSNTIEDFWRMVWDYSVGTVVMLNELKEKGQVYPIYWPSEGSVNFGEFVIETTSHEIFQDFSERELTVAKKKDPKVVRRVHHYQVAGWADKDIPANPQCILDLINMVDRSQRNSNNAPVIVQCSNGVGRSGTFCAILSIIERLKTEQVIDVCQSVKVIRVNRPKAVDSKKQYIFCYNLVQKYLDSFSDYANFN